MKINTNWLKDSNNEYSYARVCGFICIVSNLIWRFYLGISGIENVYQVIVGCCGLITGVLLWLIELFKELKNISVKLGDKEYSVKRGE